HRAFGQSAPFGEIPERYLHLDHSGGAGQTPEQQVDKERGGLSVVTHKVRHQRVDDVGVERKRGHGHLLWQWLPYYPLHALRTNAARVMLSSAGGRGTHSHHHWEHVMIKGIKFASIPVRDQDRALAFYTQKLGLRVITDSPFDGTQRWIELGIPRPETKLVLFTAPGQEAMIGGFMNVTFMAMTSWPRQPSCARAGWSSCRNRKGPIGARPRSSRIRMEISSCSRRHEGDVANAAASVQSRSTLSRSLLRCLRLGARPPADWKRSDRGSRTASGLPFMEVE